MAHQNETLAFCDYLTSCIEDRAHVARFLATARIAATLCDRWGFIADAIDSYTLTATTPFTAHSGV